MNFFINYLLSNDIIKDIDIGVVKYGVKSFVLNLSNIIGILFISLIFDDLKIGFLFLSFFIPIRVLLGGYHCSTPIKCFISFNFLFIGIYICSEYIKHIYEFSIVLIIVLLICRNYILPKKKYLNCNKYFLLKNFILFIYLIVMFFSRSLSIYKSLFIASFMNVILLFLAKVVKD